MVIKIVKCAWVLIACAGVAGASQLPDAPSVTKRDVAFAAAGFASAAADAITTNNALTRGCYETNPLMGRRPSPSHVWGFVMALTTGQEFVAWEFKHHGHARIAGMLSAGIVAVHTPAAIHNAELTCTPTVPAR